VFAQGGLRPKAKEANAAATAAFEQEHGRPPGTQAPIANVPTG